MTVTTATTTKSPLLFQSGGYIWSDEVKEVIEMLNYAYAHWMQPLAVVNPYRWTSSDFAPHLTTHVSGTDNPVYKFMIYIPPDYATIQLSATYDVHASTTSGIDLDYVVGSASGTLQCDTDETESSVDISTSTSGTGWRLCSLHDRKDNTLEGGANYFLNFRIQVKEVADASIPAPPSGDF